MKKLKLSLPTVEGFGRDWLNTNYPTMLVDGATLVCTDCKRVLYDGEAVTVAVTAHVFEHSAEKNEAVLRCECGFEHGRFLIDRVARPRFDWTKTFRGTGIA